MMDNIALGKIVMNAMIQCNVNLFNISESRGLRVFGWGPNPTITSGCVGC